MKKMAGRFEEEWLHYQLKEAMRRGDCYIDDENNIVVTDKGALRAFIDDMLELLRVADKKDENFDDDVIDAIILRMRTLLEIFENKE